MGSQVADDAGMANPFTTEYPFVELAAAFDWSPRELDALNALSAAGVCLDRFVTQVYAHSDRPDICGRFTVAGTIARQLFAQDVPPSVARKADWSGIDLLSEQTVTDRVLEGVDDPDGRWADTALEAWADAADAIQTIYAAIVALDRPDHTPPAAPERREARS